MPYTIALDELMHHGILGMKWGKRNGPPYPLEYKKLSPEEKAQAKSKAIREGNVKEAAANINEFTNDELRQLRDRFNLNQDIAKINASTKKTGAQKVDKAIDWINRGVRAADAGSKAYNAFAKISNALNPDEDSQLPLIGEKKAPKNKAEGKTKQQMLDMVKSGKLSTKDYKDISERMEAIDKTESFFKPKKKITEKDFYEMIEHPDRYTAEETKEGWEKFKVVNAAKSSKGYENYKEERDFYGFYHGLVEEIEHSAKGTTWSKKDAKYKSRKMVNGKWVYDYGKEGYASTAGAGKEIRTTEESINIVKTPKSLEEAKKMSPKSKKSYHTTKEEVKVINKPKSIKKVKSSKYISKGKIWLNKASNHAQKNANQAAKEREKQQAAKESAKRQQQSKISASQRNSLSYKISIKKSYYINKAKSWINKLFNRVQKNANQVAKEHEKQQAAKESAKRQQQSKLGASQRKSLYYKASVKESYYANKAKSRLNKTSNRILKAAKKSAKSK